MSLPIFNSVNNLASTYYEPSIVPSARDKMEVKQGTAQSTFPWCTTLCFRGLLGAGNPTPRHREEKGLHLVYSTESRIRESQLPDNTYHPDLLAGLVLTRRSSCSGPRAHVTSGLSFPTRPGGICRVQLAQRTQRQPPGLALSPLWISVFPPGHIDPSPQRALKERT